MDLTSGPTFKGLEIKALAHLLGGSEKNNNFNSPIHEKCGDMCRIQKYLHNLIVVSLKHVDYVEIYMLAIVEILLYIGDRVIYNYQYL